MSLEFNIKALIAKATQEYAQTAQSNPIVKSEEDGTVRGDDLNMILEQQEVEKKELWARVHALENKLVEKGRNVVVGEPLSTDKKGLLKLMNLDQQLCRKVTLEMEKVNLIDRPEEAVLEIQFREKLNLQIEQYEEIMKCLKANLAEMEESIAREEKTMRECDKINKRLSKQASMTPKVEALDKLRADLAILQKKYDKDVNDMKEFLNEYYPPHVVDGAGPLGDECDLAIVLEQLLNQAYTYPNNPYLPLVPGTYFSPYIETLIKAGIASFHPDDAKLLRLVDFRLP